MYNSYCLNLYFYLIHTFIFHFIINLSILSLYISNFNQFLFFIIIINFIKLTIYHSSIHLIKSYFIFSYFCEKCFKNIITYIQHVKDDDLYIYYIHTFYVKLLFLLKNLNFISFVYEILAIQVNLLNIAPSLLLFVFFQI